MGNFHATQPPKCVSISYWVDCIISNGGGVSDGEKAMRNQISHHTVFSMDLHSTHTQPIPGGTQPKYVCAVSEGNLMIELRVNGYECLCVCVCVGGVCGWNTLNVMHIKHMWNCGWAKANIVVVTTSLPKHCSNNALIPCFCPDTPNWYTFRRTFRSCLYVF